MENKDNDDDDDFPFDGLFAPIEKILSDFDRFFSGFPTIFSIPSQEFNNENSQSSTSLRDEVLKPDIQSTSINIKTKQVWFILFLDKPSGDENLDSTIEQHGFDSAFPRTFSSSSMMTTMQRETTPSGNCIIEKKVQHSSNNNTNNKTETISKICGDKYHTTIKQDGKIIREYGNSTLDELNQIDESNSPIVGGDKHSDFFKKLFS